MKSIAFSLIIFCIILGLSACQTTPPFPQWRWDQAEAGLPRQAIFLTVTADPDNPNRLWAGFYDSGGLATSLDGGQTWSTGAIGLDDNPIFALLFFPPSKDGDSEGVLWAATRDGLMQSLDGGESWQMAPGNLPPGTAFALAKDAKGRLYVGLDGAGVYAQTDRGWQSLAQDETLRSAAVFALAVAADGQQLYAGTSGLGIFASSDGGQSWTNTYFDEYAPDIVLNPNNPAIAVASLRDRLVRTFDSGQSWHTIPLTPAYNEFVSLLWLADGTLGVGTSQGLLYRSQDEGDTWLQGGAGLPPGGVLALAVTGDQALDGPNRLLVGTWTGLYTSDDGGQTLTYLSPSLGTPRAQTLLTSEAGLFLGSSAGLFRWQPDTQQWVSTSGELPSGVASLAVNPLDQQTFYAGTLGDGVYRSENAGVTWESLPSIQKAIPALAVAPNNPDHIYLLAAWERVYASRDSGQSWEARWEGLGEVVETTSLAVDPLAPIVYAGTEHGLYRSEYGEDWDLVGWDLAGQSILALLVQSMPNLTGHDSILYIGTTRGVYRSLDAGDSVEGSRTWGRGLENLSVTAFLAEDDALLRIFAGTAYAGVYQTIDGGQTWQSIGPAELSGEVIESMAWGPNGELFIVTTNGVWMGQRQ